MNKLFSCVNGGRNGSLVRVLGMWFGLNVWGNCFSPAMCLSTPMLKSYVNKQGEVRHPARWILTLRWNGAETNIYWRGALRVDWSSAHIARRFGKAVEAPHGLCHHYVGWLGTHWDV